MHTKDFLKEMERRLNSEKERLMDELRGFDTHTEVGADYDENATEIQIDEVSLNMRKRIEKDLHLIDIALDKISSGTYGTDSEGNKISEERLRALPWADKSV